MPLFKQLKVLTPLVLSKALQKDSPQRKRVNSFLVKQMGESKGLWLKVGQMLSLHAESWQDLEKIPQSENIPSLHREEFEPYLKSLFQAENVKESLVECLQYPGLAASLSQVHSLGLNEEDSMGIPWVMKVKLPGIKEVIEDQLGLFGLLSKVNSLTDEKKSFSTHDYQNTIHKSFEKELDYEEERQNLKLMQKLCIRFPKTSVVPRLHPKLQGLDFITMEQLSGDSWETVLKSYSYEEKQSLGEELFKQCLFQYFCLGHGQGDFHPGNFFFNKDSGKTSIGWIDLGQCLRPSLKERRALFLAINGLLNQENLALGPLFSAWNFNLEKLSPIAERLPLLLTKIFAPLLFPNTFNLKDWHLKKDIDSILGEDRWWFRTAGSPELFLSIRAWIGLFSMLESLGVPLFFKGLWNELLPEIIHALPEVDLPKNDLKSVSFDDLAKKLRVQIFEGAHEKVSLELPARAIEEMDDFISPHTLGEMEKVGLNLNQITRDQLKNGLRPDVVVDYKEGQTRYLVTLI